METNSHLSAPLPRMTVTTDLSSFLLLDRITKASEETVVAEVNLKNAPHYIGLEVMAQAGAYHVRFLCGFEKQAVLLMIRSCTLPAEERLYGRYIISGTLRSRSASVFGYEMSAVMNDVKVLDGNFVFTAVAYNSDLQEDILKPYYERKWENLRKG